MLERFYPKEWLDSTYEIPWEDWRARGIRGVLFDIDNTLVEHDAPAAERAVALFARLHKLGIGTCLISNNREPRVKAFAERVDSLYIYKARKPGRKNYLRAMELLGTDRTSTLFVGDQLFTDVCGANACGIYSILVKPIDPREEIQIVLKRYLEAVVLHFYKRTLNSDRKETNR